MTNGDRCTEQVTGKDELTYPTANGMPVLYLAASAMYSNMT